MATGSSSNLVCSIIVPVYNCAAYLPACLNSILAQDHVPLENVELILFDDSSTDNSLKIAQGYEEKFCSIFGRYKLLESHENLPSGVGSARNRACEAATSDIFVFQDADDVMMPDRVSRTLEVLKSEVISQRHPKVGVVGGNFHRIPKGSTPRYERYHRSVTTERILACAFRDAPLAMPTVSCLREVWNQVGKFVEGRGIPEDLHFLYSAMELGYKLFKLDGASITGYRYHSAMASKSISRRNMLTVRAKAFERMILKESPWKEGFSIWNSGRDGKDFFKRLSEEAQSQVLVWGDIDPRKIGKKIHGKPVVHFSQLRAPFVTCVAMDRGGEFEANLASLGLTEVVDYFHMV